MSSFAVRSAKAPVAAKAFKGLNRAGKAARKVSNVKKVDNMMVWTPVENKCALLPHGAVLLALAASRARLLPSCSPIAPIHSIRMSFVASEVAIAEFSIAPDRACAAASLTDMIV